MMSETTSDKSSPEKLVTIILQLPPIVQECFERLAGLAGVELELFLRDEVLRTYLEILEVKHLEEFISTEKIEAENALKKLKKMRKNVINNESISFD